MHVHVLRECALLHCERITLIPFRIVAIYTLVRKNQFPYSITHTHTLNYDGFLYYIRLIITQPHTHTHTHKLRWFFQSLQYSLCITLRLISSQPYTHTLRWFFVLHKTHYHSTTHTHTHTQTLTTMVLSISRIQPLYYIRLIISQPHTHTHTHTQTMMVFCIT